MRVLTIVHERDAGPGVFDGALLAAGAAVDTWFVAEEAQPPAAAGAYAAVISLGGSAHPHQEDRFPWLAIEKRLLATALADAVPVLGICLGSELIAAAAGAQIMKLAAQEIGWYEVRLTDAGHSDPVVGAIGGRFEALEWHSYTAELPPNATALARSAGCLQAFRVGDSAWGLQFHAEVTDADFQHWLDNHRSDEDAVLAGIDPAAIARDTVSRMAAWHEIGVGMCARFLAVAAAR